MKIIDYVFYRVYSFYIKKDSTPVVRGCVFLAVLFACSFLTAINILSIAIGQKIGEMSTKIALSLIFFISLFCFFLRFRNKERILLLVEKYEDEGSSKERRGSYLVFYAIIVFLFPLVVGILRHNYHIKI